MFKRFDEDTRQIVVRAEDEARKLRHNYIGTEHLLLGLLRVENEITARTLMSLGAELPEVRRRVVQIVGEGDDV
jgi:ATP-dependent Clp protease ATP-binding subunit ClpC